MNDPFKGKSMKCPACPESALAMTARQGIEIDYLPRLSGRWLDRGELDKLIERSMSAAPTRSDRASSERKPEFVDPDYQDNRGRNTGRRKSWLNDVFD